MAVLSKALATAANYMIATLGLNALAGTLQTKVRYSQAVNRAYHRTGPLLERPFK
jgi:hypothetical protein